MILKLKESNYEPEKNGLMIHISNVNIQGISDLKGFAELKKKQELFHYIILLDKEAKPHLIESLKPNGDTNLEFKNYDTILKLKEILKSREFYNRNNLEYLVEELRSEGKIITDGNDYNHSFYNINILGDFLTEPLAMTYNEIAQALYYISNVFHTKFLENNYLRNNYKFNLNTSILTYMEFLSIIRLFSQNIIKVHI